MTNKIIEAWNAQADHMNQWDMLGEDEKLAWAYKQGLEDLAARFDQPHMEYFGTEIAEAAQELKEQQHG